ncbi:MAG: hypothetical protein J6V93_01905 [Clostridia bacterium]|nr:hypothetical protein [Clostridia bacterium]
MQLEKEFFHKFEENFAQYGFRKKGKTYMRVVGEVLQVLNLIKSKNNLYLRLTFGTFPLCSKISYLPEGIYHIAKVGSLDDAQGCITNDRILKEGTNQIVNELIEAVRATVIPYFESTTSCRGALDENIKIEYALNDIRRKTCDLLQTTTMIGLPIDLCDSHKLYMALKCNEIAIAMAVCHMIKGTNLLAIRPTNKKKFSCDVWDKRIKDVEEVNSQLDDILNSLLDNDREYINNILSQNEKDSLSFLKSKNFVS